MRGQIGAGKSYTARRICAESGARLLSVDRYMDSVFGDMCPGREKRVEAESVVLSFCLQMAAVLDSIGISAVIDHGFWLKNELEVAELFLRQHGIEYRVVTVTADFATRLSRVEDRTDGKCFDSERLKYFDGFFED